MPSNKDDKLQLLVCLVSKKGKSQNGLLRICHCRTYAGTMGWKAVFSSPSLKARMFGVARDTVSQTVSLLLDKLAGRLPADEPERILRLARGMDQQAALRRVVGSHLGSQPTESGILENGSQPTEAGILQNPSQPTESASPVRWVHQIYGLFRDGKDMPDLFTRSMQKWKTVAFNMGATYHLWTADEVDTLIKDQYPFIWKVYQNVRYPVMRCDIGRVAILHAFGGMYSDLDVLPNRLEFAQTELTVCSVPARDARKKYILDMEVIIATVGNPILVSWLRYMAQRIAKLKWKSPNSFWAKAKMRYIWWTTGPMSMMAFLRLSANQAKKESKPLSISFMQVNRPDLADDITRGELSVLDVISHQSISYMTKASQIKVPVNHVSVPLPQHWDALMASGCAGTPVAKRRRIRVKTSAENDRAAQAEAHSQPTPEGYAPKAPGEENEISRLSPAAVAHLEAEIEALRASVKAETEVNDEWLTYMISCRNCVSFRTLYLDMPQSLQTRIVQKAGTMGIATDRACFAR